MSAENIGQRKTNVKNEDAYLWISILFYIAFYGCSKIIWTRKLTIFTVYAKIFEQFMVAFLFFYLHNRNRSLQVGPSEKVRYLTLDLLKIFSLWTIRKKTTINESLNVWL